MIDNLYKQNKLLLHENKQLHEQLQLLQLRHQETRFSELRFRTIFDAVSDAIFIHAQDGTLLDVNRYGCELFGYGRAELCRRKLGELGLSVNPRTDEHVLAYLRRAVQEDTPQMFEWQARHASGNIWWAETRLQHALVGEVHRVVAVTRDISRRRESELARQRLEVKVKHGQKLESLGLLAGGIAHDFNNLLLAVLGNTDMALMDLGEEHEVAPYLRDVIETTRRGSDLCAQLMAYSGKGSCKISQTNLSQLVRDIARLLDVSLGDQVRLDYELHPRLPIIGVDATQVGQVIMNLITNAAEAGKGRTRVVLSTGVGWFDRPTLETAYLDDALPEGEYVWFKVSDDGKGMDEPTRASMFDPFFTTKPTGRGLGLATALGNIRAHGGAIMVTSKPGQGTSITVLFPAINIVREKTFP